MRWATLQAARCVIVRYCFPPTTAIFPAASPARWRDFRHLEIERDDSRDLNRGFRATVLRACTLLRAQRGAAFARATQAIFETRAVTSSSSCATTIWLAPSVRPRPALDAFRRAAAIVLATSHRHASTERDGGERRRRPPSSTATRDRRYTLANAMLIAGLNVSRAQHDTFRKPTWPITHRTIRFMAHGMDIDM